MKIRKFTIYSLIYIVLVGVLVFTINSGNYNFEILGYSFNFPVAFWIVLPTAIMAILAILHLIFNSFNIFLEKRSIKQDSANFDTLSKEILLGFETNKEFKTEFFETPLSLANFLSPFTGLKEAKFKNETLQNIANLLIEIKNGKFVDLKKFKLPKTNPLFIKNELNHLECEPKYAIEILKNRTELNDEIGKKAYEILIKNGTWLEIKKFNFEKNKTQILEILDRFCNEEGFEVAKDEIFALLNSQDFDKSQYFKIAQKLQQKIQPDTLVAMFEKISLDKNEAYEIYLYLLFEFGMLDKLREQLLNADESENEIFSNLLFLREQGRRIPAKIFFE